MDSGDMLMEGFTGPLTIVLCYILIVFGYIILDSVVVRLRKEDLGAKGLLIREFRQSPIKHRWLQRTSIIVITVLYMYGAYLIYVADPQSNGIIVGSLLGAFPPVIKVFNDFLSQPYVVVDDLRIIEYPDKWYVFGTEKEEKEAENAICLQATLRNEGGRKAEDCEVKISSSLVDNLRYHTRWSDGNSIRLDLTPGEQQDVDLLWVDSKSRILKTAQPFEEEDESHFPPGSYGKIKRHEISGPRQKLQIEIRASNMREKCQQIRLNGNHELDIPSELIENKQEWEVITSLKDGDENYVIRYNRLGNIHLEVPHGFDISYLADFGDFDRESIPISGKQSYEDAMEESYNIERVGP